VACWTKAKETYPNIPGMARLDAATSSLFHAKAVLGYSARYQAAHDMMTTTGF
jgi:hypothetical protein